MSNLPPPPPPLPPHKLRAGETLLAGLGISTILPDGDFETYSEAGMVYREEKARWGQPDGATGTGKGLTLTGSARYSEHPSTQVLTFAYDLKDGRGSRVWVPGLPNPVDLFEHLASGGLFEAWNVGFERNIWWNVCRKRYGWPEWPLSQMRCAMAKSRAHGLPGKLDIAGEVTGVQIQKDKDGKRLLDKFSVPRNPTKTDPRMRITLQDDPADGMRLVGYNVTDIEAEAGVSAECPDLEGDELAFWQADQAINSRGVHIDRAGVENCIAIVDQAHLQYNAELNALTGGEVRAASELSKLKAWLHAQGCHMDEMDDDAITLELERMGESVQDGTSDPSEIAPAYRALEIRQAIGSASVKKVRAMAMQVCADDRLRDLFSYHAARTGRPTGNGPQPTNLPKAGPTVFRCACGRHSNPREICAWCGVPRPPGTKDVEWCIEAAEDALVTIESRDLAEVERVFGDAMLSVSGCLRALFDAAPGKELIASDFTAIEAVVLAALAGETWRLDVFRAGTDIYLESISRSTGTPLAELVAFKKERGMHHPFRQSGKVTELALGFAGWIGAMKAMYGQLGIEMTKDDVGLKADILAWRNASPAIVEFWGGQSRDFGRRPGMFGLEGAAVSAVQNPGNWYAATRLDGSDSGVAYGMRRDVLYCRLPSGRHLAYHRPRLAYAAQAWRGLALTFEGYNTNQKKGKPGWMKMDLYGGLLCENVVQATARDIQRAAILNLERAGYPVVLHVYDEDVVEVPIGFGSVEEVERLMTTLPDWCADWPIKAAGGWRGRRYRKA